MIDLLWYLVPSLCEHPARALHAVTPEPEVVVGDNPEFEHVTQRYHCFVCRKDVVISHARCRGGLKAFLARKYAR